MTRRKALRLWQGNSPGSVLLESGRAYVADGPDLAAYNPGMARPIWKISAGGQIDAVLGVIAGSLVTAEAGDLVCRDVSTGTETLRFQAVFELNKPVPSHTVQASGIVFTSGLQLLVAH